MNNQVILSSEEIEELNSLGIIWTNKYENYDWITMVTRKFKSTERVMCCKLLKHGPHSRIDPVTAPGAKIKICFIGTEIECKEWKYYWFNYKHDLNDKIDEYGRKL